MKLGTDTHSKRKKKVYSRFPLKIVFERKHNFEIERAKIGFLIFCGEN